MYLARSMPRILLPLIVFLLFGRVLPPSSTDRAAGQRPPTYRIQSVAVSDIDGDQLLDRATVTGAGPNKIIRVCLSHNNGSSVLSFSSASLGAGSLLASDVDQDGDVDLVWTDLTNSGEVVVWLNDGVGRFERATLGTFTGGLVIDGQGLAEGNSTERQIPGGTSHRTLLDAGLTSHPRAQVSRGKHDKRRSGCVRPFPLVVLDPERGPPALLI